MERWGGRNVERTRARGREELFATFFTSCLKGYRFIMPKRRRKPEYTGESNHRKRRRHNSLSPSSESANEMENAIQIRKLQIELDILKAQLKLLRRQLNDIRQVPLLGKEDEKSSCSLM